MLSGDEMSKNEAMIYKMNFYKVSLTLQFKVLWCLLQHCRKDVQSKWLQTLPCTSCRREAACQGTECRVNGCIIGSILKVFCF